MTVVFGTSEEKFGEVLQSVSGDLSFWLDGHYSGGPTFRGQIDTPIMAELHQIELMLNALENISIFVDDVRCFSGLGIKNEHYPPLRLLVDWAERNELSWTIEHDIFVMSKGGK